MSRIIQPLGPIVRRIVLEFDAKGQVQVKASNIMLGKETPMHPLQMCSALSGIVAVTLNQGVVMQNNNQQMMVESEGVPNGKAED